MNLINLKKKLIKEKGIMKKYIQQMKKDAKSVEGYMLKMNGSQMLLRSQFSNIQGFQNCLKGQNLSFQRMTGSFIQIIHADGNHWITVEGVHSSLVRVYDSRYQSTHRCRLQV